jgi:hypothetical protein
MAGLCDDCLPLSYYYEKLNLDRFEIKENRNTIASIVAGSLVCERFVFVFDKEFLCFSLLLVGG